MQGAAWPEGRHCGHGKAGGGQGLTHVKTAAAEAAWGAPLPAEEEEGAATTCEMEPE